MPRRLGRFQKAFVDWYAGSRSRFQVPISLKMVKPGCVLIRFTMHPTFLKITARPNNLGVWVEWQGVTWDALLDLDVLAGQTRQGLTCRLCEGSPHYWPSLEALWADHLFEPFLAWVNERYAKADAVLLFGNADTFTMAKLRQPDQPSDITPTNHPTAQLGAMPVIMQT